MSSPLSNADPDLSSAEERGPGSEELSCSDGEGKGSVDLFDSSDEDIQGGLLKRKQRCFTPVAMSTRGDERSGHCSNYVSKSAPPRHVPSKPRRCSTSPAKSVRLTSTSRAKHRPCTGRKVLNLATTSTGGDSESTLTAVLGDISNMLGKVMERLDRTESKIESMERSLNSQPSSSGASGSEHRRKVPTVVRTETRKTYKALLDTDEFTGFDLSPETTYRDEPNKIVCDTLLREVKLNNPSFSTADIRAAVYTYYTSLCQNESLKRKGTYSQRKVQRRRRERVVRRRTERVSEFQKMSYSDSDREKWRKVLVNQLMSSDESEYEDDQAVFVVKELPWRSSKVTAFFEKLDGVRQSRKTEQASRQTKRRVRKGLMSLRPPPPGLPSWALKA